jgi:hypothetical protein
VTPLRELRFVESRGVIVNPALAKLDKTINDKMLDIAKTILLFIFLSYFLL